VSRRWQCARVCAAPVHCHTLLARACMLGAAALPCALDTGFVATLIAPDTLTRPPCNRRAFDGFFVGRHSTPHSTLHLCALLVCLVRPARAHSLTRRARPPTLHPFAALPGRPADDDDAMRGSRDFTIKRRGSDGGGGSSGGPAAVPAPAAAPPALSAAALEAEEALRATLLARMRKGADAAATAAQPAAEGAPAAAEGGGGEP
jgi:hypothetical protein